VLNETFRVEDGMLVRAVIPERGTPYEHRCPLAAYEEVAHAIDALGDERSSLEDLVARTKLPHTQVNTAFAFMKERGCVVPAHKRRQKAASNFVFEDAMIEYHALREGDQDA